MSVQIVTLPPRVKPVAARAIIGAGEFVDLSRPMAASGYKGEGAATLDPVTGKLGRWVMLPKAGGAA